MAGTPLAQWSVDDVCDWLGTHRGKLGHKTDVYIAMAQNEDVDGEVLMDITDQGLQQLGVASFGHRHYLLKLIAQMKGKGVGTLPGLGAHGMGWSQTTAAVSSSSAGSSSHTTSRESGVGSVHTDTLDPATSAHTPLHHMQIAPIGAMMPPPKVSVNWMGGGAAANPAAWMGGAPGTQGFVGIGFTTTTRGQMLSPAPVCPLRNLVPGALAALILGPAH